MVSIILIIMIAFVMGIHPIVNILQCCMVFLILFVFMLAIAWLSILIGLMSHSAENARGLAMILSILPYYISDFVLVDTMPDALRIFAQYQPLKYSIETLHPFLMAASHKSRFLLL